MGTDYCKALIAYTNMIAWNLVQGNTDCVKRIFNSRYWDCLDEKEEVTSHEEVYLFLGISGVLIALIITFLLVLHCRKKTGDDQEDESKESVENLDTTEQYKT